jgi:hypothetical protein
MMLLFARQASAVIMLSPDARVQTYAFTATTGTLEVDLTATITSANRIVGYHITGTSNGIVGFYDGTLAQAAADATGLFDEAGCAANAFTEVWYPAPKELTTGLVLIKSVAACYVTIFYE